MIKLINTTTTKSILVGAIAVAMSGCAAIQTGIEHHSLETTTKMSNTIFLDPVAKANQSIYVQFKNTSDQKMNLKQGIIQDLQNNGWKVTQDLAKAHSMVQVSVLQAGKAKSKGDVLSSLTNGFGGAVAGGLVGNAIGNNADSTVAGGVVGGLASFVANEMVKDVTYSLITDVQVSVRAPKGAKVNQVQSANLQQGTSTNINQNYASKTNWLRYRTRIVSYADKVNLDWMKAEPKLAGDMSKEIANIFS